MSTDVSGRGRELITHRPRCALVTLDGGMDGSCMGGPSSTLQRCDWKYNWAYANPPQTNGWTDGGPFSHKSGVAGIGLRSRSQQRYVNIDSEAFTWPTRCKSWCGELGMISQPPPPSPNSSTFSPAFFLSKLLSFPRLPRPRSGSLPLVPAGLGASYRGLAAMFNPPSADPSPRGIDPLSYAGSG